MNEKIVYNDSHGEEIKNNELKKLLRRFVVLIVFMIGVILFKENIVTLNFIDGNSMNPYVYDKGVVISDTGKYELERYSVYIIKMPKDESVKLGGNAIKRLIGLPHDTLRFSDGTIYINGNRINAEYDFFTSNDGEYEEKEIMLKENEYFFVGDNRNNSIDSRAFGAISEDKIIGKVINVLYKGKCEKEN